MVEVAALLIVATRSIVFAGFKSKFEAILIDILSLYYSLIAFISCCGYRLVIDLPRYIFD